MRLLHSDITENILKAFNKVYNELGFGFPESVYENALYFELKEMGFYCAKQKPVKIYYREQIAGEFFADIIVEGLVMVELKTVESLGEEQESELFNFLKASEIEDGLLLNFGKTPEFKKLMFTNDIKNTKTFSSVYNNVSVR